MVFVSPVQFLEWSCVPTGHDLLRRTCITSEMAGIAFSVGRVGGRGGGKKIGGEEEKPPAENRVEGRRKPARFPKGEFFREINSVAHC